MANQCEQLVRLLKADGIDAELVQTNAAYRPSWVGRIPLFRAIFRLLPYLHQLWLVAGRVQVLHVLANSGWAWHLFALPAAWIGRLRGAGVIINYRGGNADSFFRNGPRHVLATLRRADARVTPSAFLQRVFAQHGLEAVIVPNIIDLSRFQHAERGPFGDAPHLIVTRNLEPIYDIGTAIRAFKLVRARFRNARLTVAGSGPERDRLHVLVKELGLASCVEFCGRLDNADIPSLYTSADCMLNPSTVDNMPISILEAFASGVPVVSTAAGGIPDLVDNGATGLLVPIGDFEAMGAAALRVLTDAPFSSELRTEGVKVASTYGWPTVRDQWLTVYRAVARPASFGTRKHLNA